MLSVLLDDAGLLALSDEWEALWHRAARSPFQSPAWLLPWWAAFGTGRPVVTTLRDPAGALQAVLPLYLLDVTGARKLLPLGVGLTDYCDVLLDPAAPANAASMLLATSLAAGLEQGATVCTLPDLPPGAELLAAALPAGWDESLRPTDRCPVLSLKADLRATIPPGMLRDVRQARHRAERMGGYTAGVAAEPSAHWADFVTLHRARWTRLGAPDGVLGEPAVLAFHAAALPRLSDADAIRLYELRIGGRLAAAYYTLLESDDRLLFYLSAFDEALSRASPGSILLAHIVEQAIAEGRRELHFLRGGEAYKYAWGAVDRVNTARDLQPNALALCLAGRISPEVAVARLVMSGRNVTDDVAAHCNDKNPRWQAVARLVAERRDGLERIAAMLRDAGEQHVRASSLADVARLFDAAVRCSPEASVAAYSLGDPAILAAATTELLEWLTREGLISDHTEMLDLGCGIGRVTVAAAPHVRSVRGLDVSPEMITEARRRYPDLNFDVTDGQDLAFLPEAACDLVLAVDSFPYLLQAGVAERHVADAARALRPGGALAILNLSYRADPAADAADVRRWASSYGLRVVHSGVQPFTLWDGTAYVLQR